MLAFDKYTSWDTFCEKMQLWKEPYCRFPSTTLTTTLHRCTYLHCLSVCIGASLLEWKVGTIWLYSWRLKKQIVGICRGWRNKRKVSQSLLSIIFDQPITILSKNNYHCYFWKIPPKIWSVHLFEWKRISLCFKHQWRSILCIGFLINVYSHASPSFTSLIVHNSSRKTNFILFLISFLAANQF